jgi:hypothetical protein
MFEHDVHMLSRLAGSMRTSYVPTICLDVVKVMIGICIMDVAMMGQSCTKRACV